MATVNEKKYLMLISETNIPSASAIQVFKDSIKVVQREDLGTGETIPCVQWVQCISNGSKKTGNDNLFPKIDVQPAIEDGYVQDRLQRDGFYNEFEHPSRNDPERYVQVYDSCVSDKIIKFWYESVNGDDCLFALCETATYSKGVDMRRKISQGAIPAKSLRASGEVYVDSMGRERKRLNIIAYDNVFMPADRHAWGDFNAKEKSRYLESLQQKFREDEYKTGSSEAIKFFKESAINLKEINGLFREIDSDKKLIMQSIGFTPEKVLVSKNSNKIIYLSESSRVVTTLSDKMKAEVNEFLRQA